MDSDGDGLTNGDELGDPNCDWKEGEEPYRVTGITHPGKTALLANHTISNDDKQAWVLGEVVAQLLEGRVFAH